MKTLTVRAAEGLSVPMEDNPRRHIGADPVTVPDRAYYRRLLRAGDLLDATTETAATEMATGTDAGATAAPVETKKKKRETRA
ncbi:DUF2635 domain-containing protein [Salmonella enterica subsp. enterica serovar Vitkin]|uniref:DUF2635 domain-containing protein n=3 Tax=Salmonella enterica TaxID=28901 RepID=A0A748FH15_SALER|nr:hypothetical protein [Salmonella bongori]EAA4373528.1 DUF2635 domain-containing protein [Salmonella enterica subsp. enterica serovar Abony]EAB6843822.1 DUF2635 domain-containing protein [Salmonella enterica subsp. salamae]EAC0555079.1 DUF2635 domain-containing protein [Salmonella enterica subsp. enterica serovar Richmond]EAR6709947.1 DUF2635 domain-containing protein [Salmonella enterica]EBV3644434.1 DUF2635 domain-containing protein [Salmonella enterica subsp. enterica serovar Kottbus]EBV